MKMHCSEIALNYPKMLKIIFDFLYNALDIFGENNMKKLSCDFAIKKILSDVRVIFVDINKVQIP